MPIGRRGDRWWSSCGNLPPGWLLAAVAEAVDESFDGVGWYEAPAAELDTLELTGGEHAVDLSAGDPAEGPADVVDAQQS
ncbi:MAG UNVERIFIED_CONTAM: hypothetical protein LOD86_00070 [Thermobifida fusca]